MVGQAGWVEARLGDYATFLKGSGLSKAQLVENGEQSCIHYGELFTHYGPLIDEVTSRCEPMDGGCRSTPGDVLMPGSDVTPRGLATASAVMVDGVVLGGDVIVIRPEKKSLCGPFLANVIRSNKSAVLRLVKGSTVYHIHAKDLADLAFMLPPLKEQEAIAEALSDADSAIEALDGLIAKKRDVKQAAMQQLLTGRTRLPGFHKDWLSLQVQEITTFVRRTIDPLRLGDEEVDHYSLPAFDAGQVERVTASSIGSLKLEIDRESVLVSRLNPRIPRVWWVTPSDCRSLASTEFAPLAPLEDLSHGRFLMYLIQSDRVMGRLAELAIGTTGSHQRVQPAEILNLIVNVPPFEEQKAIAQFLGDMDEEIEALVAEREKLDLVKQGMMQELLTGRVRLV